MECLPSHYAALSPSHNTASPHPFRLLPNTVPHRDGKKIVVVVALPTRTRNREPLCPRTLREQALSSETLDGIGTQFRGNARVCLNASLVLCYSFLLHHGTLRLRSSEPWTQHCVTHTYRHTLAGKIAAQRRLIGPHQTVAKTRFHSPLSCAMGFSMG